MNLVINNGMSASNPYQSSSKADNKGFTIVELLIVIVVIGILAAISIVAYNGIQDRANDTAVQSDLRNYANTVMQYQADTGEYPGNSTSSIVASAPAAGVDAKVSKSAYATDRHNFIYVRNNISPSQDFKVIAVSKSGNKFQYSSDGGLKPYTGNWGGVIDVCTNAGWTNCHISYGYNVSTKVWFSWTGS